MSTTKQGVYDTRKEFGTAKSIVLGLQHVYAMFGATVLVPLLTGLSVSVTLFCVGVGTILFHLITQRKVPIFLGSSFAYLGAFGAIAPLIDGKPNTEMLPYATGGVLVAGIVFMIIALLIHLFGLKKVMKLFPPIVTGPIIMLIGVILAPTALANIMASKDPVMYGIGILSIVIIIICNIWGKGMIKVLPILISIAISYTVACIFGKVDFSGMKNAPIVGLPPFFLPKFEIGAIITCVVVSLAAVIEAVGDVAATGATCGKNYIKDPGLVREFLGDGVAISLSGLLGGPAVTTYSENIGVLALTNIYDPFVLRVAAVFAILMSFSPLIDRFINTIPTAIIGGISFILYGMISSIGLRTIADNKIDFSNSRNVIIAAIILVSGLAFNVHNLVITIGGVTLTFGGLACASVFGIILNVVLPGQDYEFEE